MKVISLTFGFQEQDNNPSNNVESFDAIWFSALQVIITASANGVRSFHAHLMLDLTDVAVDNIDVFRDRLRLFLRMLFLYHLHRCPEFLAHQPFRCRDN